MQRAVRLLAISLMSVTAIVAFAQKRSITEKDIFQFNWIGIRKFRLTAPV